MMNVIQIQDDLKNFSEDQLIKEMQQPSGSAPQFLVLSELNRRKRVKGDFEARQAQQQPTVAQEVVASAGLPQEGMMGMSEAMAPASVDSGGIGAMMPQNMKSGGEVERYADGGMLEGIADSVDQNRAMLEEVKKGQQSSNQNPQFGFGGIGGKGGPMIRPAIAGPFTPVQRPAPEILRMPQQQRLGPMRTRLGSSRIGQYGMAMARPIYSGFPEPQSMAEGGVIKAQDGLPDEESYLSKFFGALNPEKETVEKRIAESNPLGFAPVLRSPATDATLAKLEEQEKPTTTTTEEKKQDADASAASKADDPFAPKPLTIEEELAKRQAGLDKDRDFDRYMALAQAGLGILASDKPTLAGAVGEGGMKGLEAFNQANKRYEEGLTDILNARVKLKSAKKTGLNQKDAISAIGVIDRTISNLRKEAEKSFDEDALAKIERDISQLRFQKRGLMPLAGFSYLPQDVSDSTAAKG